MCGARTEGFPRCCGRAFGASPNMGCSLCSLQKREEHYRLLYEVRQVSVRLSAASVAALTWWSGAELGSGLCAGCGFSVVLRSVSPIPLPPSHAVVALGCLCLTIETGGKQTCHRRLTTDRSPECRPVPAGFRRCLAAAPGAARGALACRLGSRRPQERSRARSGSGSARAVSAPLSEGRGLISGAVFRAGVVTNSTKFQSRLNGTFKV